MKTLTCVIILRECEPVYDETCSTKYTPKCKKTEKCSTHFTQDCSAQRYGGQCVELPQEKCRKVKKCVRNPETRCTPVKRMECGMKKFLAPKKVTIYNPKWLQSPNIFQVKHQICLPFPPSPTDEKCSTLSVQTFLPPPLPQPPSVPPNIEYEDITISDPVPDNQYQSLLSINQQ